MSLKPLSEILDEIFLGLSDVFNYVITTYNDKDIVVSFGEDKLLEEDDLDEINLRYALVQNNLSMLNLKGNYKTNELNISFLLSNKHRLVYGSETVDCVSELSSIHETLIDSLYVKLMSITSINNVILSDVDYIPYSFMNDNIDILDNDDTNFAGDKGVYVKFLLTIKFNSLLKSDITI